MYKMTVFTQYTRVNREGFGGFRMKLGEKMLYTQVKKSKTQMLGKVLFIEFVYNFQINNSEFLNEKLELTLVYMIFYFKVL